MKFNHGWLEYDDWMKTLYLGILLMVRFLIRVPFSGLHFIRFFT